jgi:hypothetical protein
MTTSPHSPDPRSLTRSTPSSPDTTSSRRDASDPATRTDRSAGSMSRQERARNPPSSPTVRTTRVARSTSAGWPSITTSCVSPGSSATARRTWRSVPSNHTRSPVPWPSVHNRPDPSTTLELTGSASDSTSPLRLDSDRLSVTATLPRSWSTTYMRSPLGCSVRSWCAPSITSTGGAATNVAGSTRRTVP